MRLDARLALQGFRHPVLYVDSLVGLQRGYGGLSVDARLALQGVRYLSDMRVDSSTGLQGSLYFTKM